MYNHLNNEQNKKFTKYEETITVFIFIETKKLSFF